MGKFARDEGEFIEGDKNFNVKDERGDDGEVAVEGQDRTLWGTPFGSWKDEGSFPNEAAAKDYVEDEQEKVSKGESSDDDSSDDDSSRDEDVDSDDEEGDKSDSDEDSDSKDDD